MKTSLGCFALALTVLASLILFEKSNVYLNKRKVDRLCAENPVLVVLDEERWNDWKNKREKFLIENDINIHEKLYSGEIKKIDDMAKLNDIYVIGYNGFPYNFPYEAAGFVRIEIYKDNKKIAYIQNFTTFSRNGPIFRSIFGNVGGTYGCGIDRFKEYSKIYGNYIHQIPIHDEIKWQPGDMK